MQKSFLWLVMLGEQYFNKGPVRRSLAVFLFEYATRKPNLKWNLLFGYVTFGTYAYIRTYEVVEIKVHIFWEGHKILRNLYLTFVLFSASQK